MIKITLGKAVLFSTITLSSTLFAAQTPAVPAPPAPQPSIAPPKSFEERITALENEVKEIKRKGNFEELALDKANAASNEVAKWTEEKLLEVYSYNFMNYHAVIKSIKNFFTQPGYESYVNAMQDSKNIEVLNSKKLIVYAIPRGGAEVIKEGVSQGIYTWQIRVPLLVSYRNEDGVIERKIDVDAEVVRQPLKTSERGYAIHVIQAKEVDAPKQTP